MESARAADRTDSGFMLGLVLIAAGIASLLERAHVFETISVSQWWPLLLIAIGLAKLRRPEERRRGWLFLGLGGWCLFVALTALTFSDTWPMLLLVWGAWMVWSGLGDVQRSVPGNRERSHAN
jgi:hypothetical protein